jgi:hypothetical protein
MCAYAALPGAIPVGDFEPPAMTAAERKMLFDHVRNYDRRTRKPGRRYGNVGEAGLRALRALLFRLTAPDGRCVASYAEIAAKAEMHRSTAIRGTAWLAELGVLDRQALAENGRQAWCGTGWIFRAPAEVFARLFGGPRVAGRDPSSQSKSTISERESGRRQLPEVLGVVGAGREPAPPMTSGQLDVALERAAQSAWPVAQLTGDAAEGTAGPAIEVGAIGGAATGFDEDLFVPAGQVRVAPGPIAEGEDVLRLGAVEVRPTTALGRPLARLRQHVGVHHFAQIVVRWIHGPPPATAGSRSPDSSRGDLPPRAEAQDAMRARREAWEAANRRPVLRGERGTL